MSEWKPISGRITIPETIDTSSYPYLMLRVIYGNNTGAIYFDNVEVVEASLTNYQVLAETDFADANDTVDDMLCHSLAFRHTADPLDETNVVLKRESGSERGSAVYLGMDYKDDTNISAIAREAIQIEPGKTNEVQFDYYYDCTEFYNESPVYLTAGNTVVLNEELETWEGKYGIQCDEEIAEIAFTTQIVSKMGNWETRQMNITFPKDYDVEQYPYLMLYNNSGSELCKLYIDNVKVMKVVSSAPLQAYDEQLSCNDYNDANDTVDDMCHHSQAFRHDTDPLDEANIVMKRASGSESERGSAVYFGMDYKDDTSIGAIAQEAIKIQPGQTYTVQFDYYYDCTDFWEESSVYLTTGNTVVLNESLEAWEGKYGIQYDEEIAKAAFTTQTYRKMEKWETIQMSITFPTDYDVEQYPYLMLYNNSGNENCKLYIDNTQVTFKAPLVVNYIIENNRYCKVIDNGTFNQTLFFEGEDAVVWYTDETCKKQFKHSDWKTSDELQILELYGVYENAASVLIKGDMDLNHTVNKDDINAMREWLIGCGNASTKIRADYNCDATSDVKDLVRIKKYLAGQTLDAFQINGNSIAGYTIVTPTSAGYDYGVVTSRINELGEAIKTANGRTNVDVIKEDYNLETEYEIIVGNAMREGVKTDLERTSYHVIAEGSKLYVNGGSEDALGAALDALLHCIRMGISINEENFIDFEYIKDEVFNNPTLTILTENFDTDVQAGAMSHWENNSYYSFFGRNPYEFFIETRRDDWIANWVGANAAFSADNISAKDGKLILDASESREITFVENGVSDTRNAYVGAEIRGRFFTYGYAEISAKLDVCSGVCPAFWLLGDEDAERFYEIDVFECLGEASKENGMIKSSLLKHTVEDGAHSTEELHARYELLNGYDSYYFPGFGNDGKFHKYAVEWTEDYIYFLYDDERVMRITLEEGEFSGPMCPILTIYSGVNVKDGEYETGSPILVLGRHE